MLLPDAQCAAEPQFEAMLRVRPMPNAGMYAPDKPSYSSREESSRLKLWSDGLILGNLSRGKSWMALHFAGTPPCAVTSRPCA